MAIRPSTGSGRTGSTLILFVVSLSLPKGTMNGIGKAGPSLVRQPVVVARSTSASAAGVVTGAWQVNPEHT